MNKHTLPSMAEVRHDRCTSYWLQNALETAISRDPLDAYYDAELLAALLKRRVKELGCYGGKAQ